MDTQPKYAVFGPQDSLRRFGQSLMDDMKPKFSYKFQTGVDDNDVLVVVFEEYQRQLNSSMSLTCVVELKGRTLRVELMPTGGRMGFRGSSLESEQPLLTAVTDYVYDYCKRFGLTIQELKEVNA